MSETAQHAAVVQPDDFYSLTPPDRIIGTETENTIIPAAGTSVSHYISSRAIMEAGFQLDGGKRAGNHNCYLDNGSRLYVDIEHLEYATPECRGPAEAAAAEMAGISVLRNIVAASGQPHLGVYRNSGSFLGQAAAAKNPSVTAGYHENYLIPASLTNETLFAPVFASHLASRLWAMNGVVNHGYQLSQKVHDLGYGYYHTRHVNRTKAGEKPMLLVLGADYDDDVSGSNSGWLRAEVRSGDPSPSSSVTFTSLGSVSLDIRLQEHADIVGRDRLQHLALANPVRAMYDFSTDLSLSATAAMQDGRRLTAADIQESHLELVRLLQDRIELPADEVMAIDCWQHMIDMLRASDLREPEPTATARMALTFVDRFYSLTNRFAMTDIEAMEPKAVQASLIYDRILDSANSLEPAGRGERWAGLVDPGTISLKAIERLIHEAPVNTRAAVRARAIRQEPEAVCYVSWRRFGISAAGDTRLTPRIIELADPYQSEVT